MGKLEKIEKIGNFFSALLLGNTRELIARIDERTEHIQKDLDEIRPKVNEIYPRVDLMWKDRLAPSHSPRQLNDRGNAVLNDSGIRQIIDEKKVLLTDWVKQRHPSTAYDAEQMILAAVNALPEKDPELTARLKEGAFRVGADIPSLLFVGGIYLRNLIFDDLGFSLVDLDRPGDDVAK